MWGIASLTSNCNNRLLKTVNLMSVSSLEGIHVLSASPGSCVLFLLREQRGSFVELFLKRDLQLTRVLRCTVYSLSTHTEHRQKCLAIKSDVYIQICHSEASLCQRHFNAAVQICSVSYNPWTHPYWITTISQRGRWKFMAWMDRKSSNKTLRKGSPGL